MTIPCHALPLLLVTTLQLQYCASTLAIPPSDRTNVSGEVIPFLDVYNRSSCQPRETMVPVAAEHPHLVSHIAVPSCVLLKRCAGCCSDDTLDCAPEQTHEQRMEVMLTRLSQSRLQQLTFTEHTQCICRPKTILLRSNAISRSCAPCRNKKKQLNPQTCNCVCRRRESERCVARGLVLNKATCRCKGLRRRSPNRRAEIVP
ncbi:vascular endothelial growth factor B isoform X2 [Elgaria multicarinata webbii]|uniref:vascular endothelial growth factor B isoform X2 n=1 Tax=Elgaria multicarinata webbii TaxID=159646 RepID=UPI002FCCCC0F